MVILVKSLDNKKYTIGKELRVSSLLEHMGLMFYNAKSLLLYLVVWKHWMEFSTLPIGLN